MLRRILQSLALTLLATVAAPQVRLPVAPLLSQPLGTLDRTLDPVAAHGLGTLIELRQRELDQLIRDHRRWIDTDPRGNPIVRGEVLASSPSEAALAHAQALGFRIAREQSIESLQLRVLVLSAPQGLATRKALKLLREADPQGGYDFNHIYLQSGAPGAPLLEAGGSAVDADSGAVAEAARVGLLDTGINLRHPALSSARIVQWGCQGKPIAAAHGTAIASLLVGRAAGFRGVQPGAQLYAADVYCGQPAGGAVDAIVAALGWLVEQNIPVINVSLVGPANFLLERAIAALSARGFLIVAAVGNDGPAAPPLYPASYPQVVGVTAVDARQQVLIEAAQGPQVMFAAPGADMGAANGESGYVGVRGTSFAAPIVAALLAAKIRSPDAKQVASAIDALSRTAVDLGPRGRDLTYGFGLVGAEYRTDPADLIHR